MAQVCYPGVLQLNRDTIFNREDLFKSREIGLKAIYGINIEALRFKFLEQKLVVDSIESLAEVEEHGTRLKYWNILSHFLYGQENC